MVDIGDQQAHRGALRMIFRGEVSGCAVRFREVDRGRPMTGMGAKGPKAVGLLSAVNVRKRTFTSTSASSRS
jgi:hypothetical protein